MALPDLTNDVPDGLLIPGFVSRRTQGVFIDLPALQAAGGFELFVDRLFTGEARFSGLDYAAFLRLLYDVDWLTAMQGKCKEVKLAEKIVRFLPERRALYRAVKILEDGKRAEYVFEPVSIEVSSEAPVYGEPDENGAASIIRYEHKTGLQPAKLDFDEFVADMWLKGVKFGIDADVVRQAIASGTSARMTIAQYAEPAKGQDAGVLEVCTHLRRDNSPKILANGKADLGTFANRFPQIAEGTRMLKKVPRMPGKPGHKVTGEVIEPETPKDMDLFAFGAVGTRVEQSADGEYIVAVLDGFLSIDDRTKKFSITEKIENKGGVSAKTTGDLMLDVDEYVEHGEVQEGRGVRGKHMTFLSDVFGNVVSQGGNISIEGNLSGGSAESMGGNVVLGKSASRAVVRARDGEVTAHYCENSTIIGRIVHIEHAVNCEIIADEVFVEVAEGCMVAAERIKIGSAGECRSRETLVTMIIPDLSEFDQGIAKLKKKIADAQAGIEAGMQEIELLQSDQEFAKYLALYEKVKSGAVKLTAEQAGNFRKLVEKNARTFNQVAKLNAEISAHDLSLKKTEEELVCVARDRDGMGAGISCVIDKITGQTSGQTMVSAKGIELFSGMSQDGIRAVLQKMDSYKARIFSEDSGSIEWKFRKSADS